MLRFLPSLVYAAGIFYLSSIPGADVPPPFPHFDKLLHFILYAGFALTLAMGLRFKWVLLVVAVYGVSDEIHQLWVPGRSGDVADWVADVLGGTAYLLIKWRVAHGRHHPAY